MQRSSIVALFWKLAGLEEDFKIGLLLAYRQTWRLKLSHTKTVTAVFHLSNRVSKSELEVHSSDKFLSISSTPTYLRVKLDRFFKFHNHFATLCKNLSSCVTLLRQLAEPTVHNFFSNISAQTFQYY